MFLSSEQAVKSLENFSDAVVCITVEQTVSAQVYGTGFFVQLNSTEDAVITNSHSIRRSMSSSGIDFRLVKPGDCVRVIFFYDGKAGDVQLTHEVVRIEHASLSDKNKGKDVLLQSMTGKLLGDGSRDTADISKCKVALGLLSSYFECT